MASMREIHHGRGDKEERREMGGKYRVFEGKKENKKTCSVWKFQIMKDAELCLLPSCKDNSRDVCMSR